jgi:hypothetical protein
VGSQNKTDGSGGLTSLERTRKTILDGLVNLKLAEMKERALAWEPKEWLNSNCLLFLFLPVRCVSAKCENSQSNKLA